MMSPRTNSEGREGVMWYDERMDGEDALCGSMHGM
jgi:hypothetical protein